LRNKITIRNEAAMLYGRATESLCGAESNPVNKVAGKSGDAKSPPNGGLFVLKCRQHLLDADAL
jgi:hypothetical protein